MIQQLKEIKKKNLKGKIRLPQGTFSNVTERKIYFKFGLLPHEHRELVEKCNNKCSICSSPPSSSRNAGRKNLAVDHCHSSGRIRGLLCMRCNVALGALNDDVSYLEKAIEYILNTAKHDL